MNLKPLYDRVVVKPIEADEVSAGGIVIADNAKEKPTKGEVVAIGKGKTMDNGQLRAPKVKVGDQVLYGQYRSEERRAGQGCVSTLRSRGTTENSKKKKKEK